MESAKRGSSGAHFLGLFLMIGSQKRLSAIPHTVDFGACAPRNRLGAFRGALASGCGLRGVAESRFKPLAAVLALGWVTENRALNELQKNHHPPYIRRGPEGFCRFFGGVGKDFEVFFRFSCEDGGDLTIKLFVVRIEHFHYSPLAGPSGWSVVCVVGVLILVILRARYGLLGRGTILLPWVVKKYMSCFFMV
jgi:hypothetical protein